MRWLQFLLALGAIAALAAFADPLDLSPPPAPVLAPPSPLAAALGSAGPAPAAEPAASSGEGDGAPGPGRAGPEPSPPMAPGDLRLPARLVAAAENFSDEPAGDAVRRLARQFHLDLVYHGDPAARFSAVPAPGETVEETLQRVFAGGQLAVSRHDGWFEIGAAPGPELRLVTWAELVAAGR